jgi:hypothetical protein
VAPVVAAPVAAVPDPFDWTFTQRTDDMTGQPIEYARINSINTVEFGFPYAGEQHAVLTLRKHPRYKNSVILEIERGQFQCGFGGCQIMVKFGDLPPQAFPASESADNNTAVVFIGQESKFYKQLLTAPEVRIEASFFQAGTHVFVFRTAGFAPEKFGATF